MPLVSCEINIILIWYANWVISAATGAKILVVTDITFCVLVVALSTQDNSKLLRQLKSGFEKIINWKKYQSKVSIWVQNNHLDYLIDSVFQGVNRNFVL